MMRILLFLAIFFSFGCKETAPAPPSVTPPTSIPPPSAPVPAGANVSFLSLGDSYTIGQGVGEAERWSVQLARFAQPEGLITPDIIARTGWTTGELQQAVASANNQKTYELVSLMIGVNNQFRGLPLATYRTEFRSLLQTSIRFAGNRPQRVFVLSIPDWGQSEAGRKYNQAQVAREIDQFNQVAEQECRQAGVAFVNITDLTRGAANDASQFAADGLHYSGKQMAQWAQRALPVVRALVK